MYASRDIREDIAIDRENSSGGFSVHHGNCCMHDIFRSAWLTK